MAGAAQLAAAEPSYAAVARSPPSPLQSRTDKRAKRPSSAVSTRIEPVVNDATAANGTGRAVDAAADEHPRPRCCKPSPFMMKLKRRAASFSSS